MLKGLLKSQIHSSTFLQIKYAFLGLRSGCADGSKMKWINNQGFFSLLVAMSQ